MSHADLHPPTVAWTDAAKKLLRPRRGLALPAKKAKSEADLRASAAGAWSTRGNAIAMGIKRADPPIAAATKAFGDYLRGEAELSVEAAAVGLTLLGDSIEYRSEPQHEALIDLYVATHGLPFALEAAARSLGYAREPEDTYGVSALWVVARPRGPAREHMPLSAGPWDAVRAAVAAASDANHAEARALAEKLRKGAPHLVRTMIAYAFPDEPAWAAADAEEGLALAHPPAHLGFLLASLRDATLAARVAGELVPERSTDVVSFALDLVAGLGVEAAEPLLALAADITFPYAQAGEVKHAALALAQIEHPKIAAFFAQNLDHKHLRASASDYFARWPELAMRALAPLATGRKDSADATALLAAAVRAHPDLAEQVAETLHPAEQKIVIAMRQSAAIEVPDASPDDLPHLLVAPPWLAKQKRKSPPIIEGLAILPRPEAVRAPAPDMPAPSPAGDARVLAQLADERTYGGRRFLFQLLELSREGVLTALARFSHESWYTHQLGDVLTRLLAQHGASMIDVALSFASEKPGDVVTALRDVDSTRVAPLMAHALLRLKSACREAERWLATHPETAAVGLVPDAIGKPGKPREAAESAIRFLVARGHDKAVRAVASQYGDAARGALDAVLAADPLALGVPARAPKMPDFWKPTALPRPLLAGRKKALPLSAVEHLGAMLAFTRHDDPYAGLAIVRDACDAESLHDFSWALFDAWILAGAPAKEQWAFFALGHLGGDEAARKLAPLVRSWPSEGAFGRAVTGLEVLAVIGSDLALMLLHGIAQKVKSRPLQQQARAKMDAIAAAQGLGADDLADRLVPDLDLDPDGSMLLSFGPRAFRVGFDELLRPFVRDADGKRLAELPKPGKADDPEAAAKATDTWKRLKKDARAVASAQIARLELALVTRRRWSPEAFRASLVEHPLLGHLTRRLVWGAYDEAGALVATFRVAEDKSFAGPGDEACALPESVSIGLVHPVELSADQAAAWGQILADYEILQPFVQLARQAFFPTADERKGTTIDRAAGRRIDGAKLASLDRFGWRRGPVEDGGMVSVYEKEVGAYRAELPLDPGLSIGMGGNQPAVTLGAVTVTSAAGPRHGGRAIPIGTLDPVLFSEIVRDLESLLDKR
jgi:hypothetical protein